MQSSSAYAYDQLAHLYGEKRQLDEALQMSQRAVELEPEEAVYLNTLSWLYYLVGTYSKAEQTIKQALLLDPDNSLYREALTAIKQAQTSGKN